MKKITSILCILCIAVFFSACKKEGVYTPSKKISKITYHTNAIDEYGNDIGLLTFTQQWIWNSNNTLKEIVEDYGYGQNTYQFEYDGKKRLVRVNSGQNYQEYTYDGNYLKEMKRFNKAGAELENYTFIHSNGKICEIRNERKYNDNLPKAEWTVSMFSPLQFILPEEVTRLMEKEQKELERKNGAKGRIDQIILKLTWSGGNVTKIVSEVSEGFNDMPYPEDGNAKLNLMTHYTTINLQYDQCHNPFNGFLVNLDNALAFNKNNIVKMEVNPDGQTGLQPYEEKYTYTYKQKYPVTKTGTATQEEYEYK